MFTVYVLKSLKTNKYYIGQTSNLKKRLEFHNQGETKTTRNQRPLILVYKEEYKTRREAIKREKQIKSYKGGRAFKNLICWGGRVDNCNPATAG